MIRIIARLDIKGPNLIKGIRFEGVRVVGDPQKYAQKYYEEGIDEIIYIDTVASFYNRISLQDLLIKTVNNVKIYRVDNTSTFFAILLDLLCLFILLKVLGVF